ncbi:hypothetical protein QUF90_05535 [Desulfococcaceae bacterium HSG9]|nr:hypothetical protein [Desulfococcaceae bacterium HSG9]
MKKQVLITVSLGLAACWLGIAIAGDINYGATPLVEAVCQRFKRFTII